MLKCVDYPYGAKAVYYHANANEDYVSCFSLRNYEDRCEIWSLMTRQIYRHRGYAERMLHEFIEQFDFSKPLVLYVQRENNVAIHLYEKVGFKITGNYTNYAYEMRYQGGNYGYQ